MEDIKVTARNLMEFLNESPVKIGRASCRERV